MTEYYCLANKDDEGNPWILAEWLGRNCVNKGCEFIDVVEVDADGKSGVL